MTATYNNVTLGKGVTLGYSTTNDYATPTLVGQLKSVGGTSFEMGTYDASGVSSQAGEVVPTLAKGGEVPFVVQLDLGNSTHIALHTAMFAGTLYWWVMTFPIVIGAGVTGTPTTHTYKFPAYITGLSTSGYEVESGIELEVKLTITGLPVTA
jgi:hypothetical protein